MIKRRSVRIKVLQAIYGFEHSDGLPLSHHIKTLKERINSVTAIYHYNFYLLRRFADCVLQEAETRSGKYIRTADDLAFNTKLSSNVLMKLMESSETLRDAANRYKFDELTDETLVLKWYREFRESRTYQDYLNSGKNFDMEEDGAIIRFLYRDFLLENEEFHQYMEELWCNWIDDAGYISGSVLQTLEKSRGSLALVTDKEKYAGKIKELEEFGIELLEQTVRGKEHQLGLIATKLKNWDIERLAATDIIILRMAIAELTGFPSIPTKVTINEYIDIAREYSTPKSKEFINGILDNLTRELKEKGLIIKEGRGLKES